MHNAPVEEKVFGMCREELDSYPYGVVTLDRAGKILRYNAAEAKIARREGKTTVGLNFWRDVAPCTAVQGFKGRFDAFAQRTDAGIETFDFVFRFAWGTQDVSIMLMRMSGVDEINVVVRLKG